MGLNSILCRAGIFLLMFSLAEISFAQYRRTNKTSSEKPSWTYDIGLASGSYNDRSYSEANLGLNWNLTEYLTWRNAAYSRFGSSEVSNSGLDTSLRLNYRTQSADQGMGLSLFAGPGYRISKKETSGLFGEAGASVRLGGLSVGLGVKAIQYNSPGTEVDGSSRPKFDTTVSVILAGGGAF